MRDILTDEQVEQEIARLLDSEEVKLAKKEQNILYRRRQYMYQLRSMEKRGKQLKADGVTLDNIESVLFGSEENRGEKCEDCTKDDEREPLL